MGVPDSGVPAAEGYAFGSGIPYGQGLVKNRYIGRTFIAPTQAERANGVRRKLNPLRENIAGKRVVVVDDSIVRGTTTRAMVKMLREAGAVEVHLRISSPPFKWPCFYGIDTPDRTELLAADQDARGDHRVPRRGLARVPEPGAPGRGHRRPRRRVLRRLPDRHLPGPGGRQGGDRRAARRHGCRRLPHGVTAPSSDVPATYAAAGVDIDAGERAVDLIKPMVASTRRPEVLGGLGDFGGLFALDTSRYRQPVLVSGTDGVGTKAAVAQAVGRYDTVGIDLVAMCVDDLVCQGAEPLFFLDYISTGSVEPARMADLVSGVAEGCRQVGATLLGGRDGGARRHHGARRVRPGRASPSAWWSGTRSWDRSGWWPATSCSACRPPGCARTATRWPATSCSSGPAAPTTTRPGRAPTPRSPTSCCCPR